MTVAGKENMFSLRHIPGVRADLNDAKIILSKISMSSSLVNNTKHGRMEKAQKIKS